MPLPDHAPPEDPKGSAAPTDRGGHAGEPRRPPTGSHCRTDGGPCRVQDLFRMLGRAHVLDILYALGHGDTAWVHYADLQRKLGISPNTLSERLRDLVALGVVKRTVYETTPPRVAYALAPEMKELEGVIGRLHDALEGLPRAGGDGGPDASPRGEQQP